MSESTAVTAAMVVIGDEVLSGRTADVNINAVATACTEHGITLVEARVVADDIDAIVGAINSLRAQVDYVFTSGGIGPTHDDITADSVAKAFGVALLEHPTAIQLLLDHYKDPAELTPARRRMARVPEGGELIYNAVTKAPGFRVENVYVMAGVPAIMRSMLKSATAPSAVVARHRPTAMGRLRAPFWRYWKAVRAGRASAQARLREPFSTPRSGAAKWRTRAGLRAGSWRRASSRSFRTGTWSIRLAPRDPGRF